MASTDCLVSLKALNAEALPATASSAPVSRASELLPELRSLFAYTLEVVLATQLDDEPELAAQAKPGPGKPTFAPVADSMAQAGNLTRMLMTAPCTACSASSMSPPVTRTRARSIG